MPLKKFSGDELIISKEDAQKIFYFFFGEQIQGELINEDVGFAQGLIIEGIERSNEMGMIEDFMKKFFWKVPTSFGMVGSIVKFFIVKSASIWWKNKNIKSINADNLKIYDSIRNTLCLNFRSVWKIRMQTGELIY